MSSSTKSTVILRFRDDFEIENQVSEESRGGIGCVRSLDSGSFSPVLNPLVNTLQFGPPTSPKLTKFSGFSWASSKPKNFSRNSSISLLSPLSLDNSNEFAVDNSKRGLQFINDYSPLK